MKHSCPYCNHAFEAVSAARVTCPRCEDAFSVRGGAAPVHSIWSREAAQAVDLGGRVRIKLKQAMIVSLLIMLVLTAYAFWKIREERKPVPPEPVPPPTAAVAPPLELIGLGYLPPNCNLIFAVQPGPLLLDAERTKQDPVELLTKNRVPASVLGALAKAGITLQNIDHIACGFVLPDVDEELRACFVLVLRTAIGDEQHFLDQLQAKRIPALGDDGYDVRFNDLPIKLAKASPTIWVFAYSEKDLANRTGGAALSPSSRELIQDWVPRDAAMWVAADAARWSEKPLLKLLLKKEWLSILAKGRAAVVSASLPSEGEWKLRVAVRCVDSQSRDKLFAYFKGKATGERSLASSAGDWAKLELPTEPKAVFSTAKGFLDDAGR